MWGEIVVGALALLGTLGGAYMANRKAPPCWPTAWSSWRTR